MPVRNVYLLMAVIGAVAPYWFFIDFFRTEGLNLVFFLQATYANGAAGGAMTDLVLSSVVFWIFMARQKDGPRAWPFILINLGIGLSCALPAYLWVVSKEPKTLRAS